MRYMWCKATFLQICSDEKIKLTDSILDALRVSTFSASSPFWVNYFFNWTCQYTACTSGTYVSVYCHVKEKYTQGRVTGKKTVCTARHSFWSSCCVASNDQLKHFSSVAGIICNKLPTSSTVGIKSLHQCKCISIQTVEWLFGPAKTVFTAVFRLIFSVYSAIALDYNTFS